MYTNHVIESGRKIIKDTIYEFQQLNHVPNFVIEMILLGILLETKELRMTEMVVESEMTPKKAEGEEINGDTDNPGDNPDETR